MNKSPPFMRQPIWIDDKNRKEIKYKKLTHNKIKKSHKYETNRNKIH